ncbi:MAG: hypothetical protein EBX52_03230, partial [Proteobacteria bacterium]|nr:hypothetical protein [Pseudomonadota bacterium]
MPLFQGGRRIGELEATTLQEEASGLSSSLVSRTLYTELLQHYGGLIADLDAERELALLQDRIREILKSYKIGGENNPVGYSGILGLKGLANRIEAERAGILASLYSHREALAERSGLDNDLSPIEKFIESFFETLPASLKRPLTTSAQSLSEQIAQKQEGILHAR